MLNGINISHVFVADQDTALDFYVGKLGLEISNDQDLGFMRWLTVRVPGQPGRDILLEKVGFTTSDCRKTYETLHAKGVEFTQEPVEQPYGIDIGVRDPFGNHIRIVQPKA